MLLEVNQLYFSHNTDQPLFRNINLRVDHGKVIALAGESGCGKSTLLNIIYGLLTWEKGEIFLEKQKLFGPTGNLVPGEKDIKLVSQQFDLMPFSTVEENVGKFMSNTQLSEKKDKITELLQVTGLLDVRKNKVKNLSGGQQQRVAIARALSQMPKLLLLDEPFSNLDFPRKIELREKLFDFAKKENISVIISTHELMEVMPWLDQIIVLQEGRLIQNDTPEETYKNPYNAYVAGLFGEVNVFEEKEMKRFGLSKRFYFPSQITLSDNGLEAEVEESRFSGNYYWNRILCNDKHLILYTSHIISGKVKINF